MTTPKPPTPPGISRLLRSAGFERSVFSGGGRVGHRNFTEGYVVRGRDEGIVVMHVFGSSATHDTERRRQRLSQYAAAIEAAGWPVTESPGRLTVTTGRADRWA